MDGRLPLAAPAALPLSNCYWVLRVYCSPVSIRAGPPRRRPGCACGAAGAGVSCFLDLTQPDELPPYDADLPLGVDYFRKPIPDHGIPLQPGQHGGAPRLLREALRSGRVVYCTAARDRPYRHGGGLPAGRERLAGKRPWPSSTACGSRAGARRCGRRFRRPPSRLSTCGAGSVRARRARIRCSSPQLSAARGCGNASSARSSAGGGGCGRGRHLNSAAGNSPPWENARRRSL